MSVTNYLEFPLSEVKAVEVTTLQAKETSP